MKLNRYAVGQIYNDELTGKWCHSDDVTKLEEMLKQATHRCKLQKEKIYAQEMALKKAGINY